ncbi:MAG: hypothetical protein NC489_46085 [Ruminococcus flavefaciens]|nr:hypothetical protein [Ruminococcus flavefaciens]
MEEKRTFFGYEKEAVLKNFRECMDQTDTNGRISEQETTLAQLAEASGRLLKENRDFLYTIYNELDE